MVHLTEDRGRVLCWWSIAAMAVMADIKQGTFIGTATATQLDSTLRSLEVVVFPDSIRGTGEGHYPWDLPGSSTTYKGGEKKIEIPQVCSLLRSSRRRLGTVRNLVCGAIVTPMEGAYGNQERHPGRFAGGA
jgi:hypothetical protein